MKKNKLILCFLIVIGLIVVLFVSIKNSVQYRKKEKIDGHAASQAQIENLQAQIDTLMAKVESGADASTIERKEQFIPQLPRGGVYAAVDFLYWQANQDGLEYGTKMLADPIIGRESETKTRLLDVHFDWDPGFRLALGYLFNRFDRWALDLCWTHIRNHAHGKSHAKGIESQTGPVDTIIPNWVTLVFELRAGASKAHAHWNVNFNTLDLDLQRRFLVSRRLDLNPYFGLRGAWIDQHYHVKYRGVFLLAEGEPFFSRDVKFKGKNDFSGIGLRTGTQLIWNLDKHWNLFADVSGSIIYGKFHVRMQNKNDQGLGEGETPPMPLDFSAKEKFWRGRLNFNEAVGLGWRTFFKQQQYHLSINAAYEMSQWLNQNELFYTLYFRGQDTISSVPIRHNGNLTFQGIKAGIQFDF